MRRFLAPALLCAAATLAVPSAASAVSVAVGSQGRALLTWTTDAGLQFAERTSAGRFTVPRTIAPPKSCCAFLWAGPGAAATVLATDTSNVTGGMLRIRRPPGAEAFEAPEPFGEDGFHVLRSASNARGDAAVLAQVGLGHLMLLTATRGGPLGAPQDLNTNATAGSVAVDEDGRVLVAYYEFGADGGVRARLGTVGLPPGPVKRLSGAGEFTEVGSALDDKGHATVAFARSDPRHRERGSELVARRAGPDGHFGAARVVALGGPPIMGAGFASFALRAAGATTALAFDANVAHDRVGVAIARGGGHFERAQRPTTPRLDSFANQTSDPEVAVDRAGDVLLAYTFGIYGFAVHVTQRRAGSDRLTSPRVLSPLGRGGGPVPALLSDRTPLVAFDGPRGTSYTTRLNGRRPDYSPPRATVKLAPQTEAELGASNAFGVRIRCSEGCIAFVRATLRTSTGRNVVGVGGLILRAGATLTKRFAFDPAKRAGRAGDGSSLRVTVDVENSSGASSETVRKITLGSGG